MDILYFLRRRTAFTRSFYERASHPFAEIQRQIERQEPPFDNPPLDESGEPAYLAEWQDAEEGLEMLGQMCLTLLSNSLKLYLDETTQKLRLQTMLTASLRAALTRTAVDLGIPRGIFVRHALACGWAVT